MDVALSTPLYSAADFRLRANGERGPHHGTDYGDHRWNPGLAHSFLNRQLRDAAVLVPIVDHRDGATMLLTKRTEKLRTHSGQIAFPGGTIDPTDGSPEYAALRETMEEIGVGSDQIDVVGRMPDYVSGTGYRVVPVLGVVKPDYVPTISEDEVDDIFEVPLSFLMDPVNHRRDSRIWEGTERFFYVMPYGERYIWGLTAGIIRTLYERLYA